MATDRRGVIPGFIIGFPALVTLLALGFGVPLMFQAKDFVDSSVAVPGQVVSIREQTDCSTTRYDRQGRSTTSSRTECFTVIYPTVKFTTLVGEPHEHEIMKFVIRFDEKPGDRVDLRYLRENPFLVQLDDWKAIWGLPLGLMALALVFGGIWAGMIWINRRARAKGLTSYRGKGERVPIWVTITTLLIPGLMAWLTGVLAAGAIEFYSNARLTNAVVVQAAASSTDYPVFEFIDHRGQKVTGEPETSPFETFNVVGMPTHILHRTDDSSVFRAAPSVYSTWKPTITVGLFALLFGGGFVGALRFIARG